MLSGDPNAVITSRNHEAISSYAEFRVMAKLCTAYIISGLSNAELHNMNIGLNKHDWKEYETLLTAYAV